MIDNIVTDTINAWHEFTSVLKRYPNVLSSLNVPCSIEKIREVEDILEFEFPFSLIELLKLNNGQKLDQVGIFKSVSGWDVYQRSIFLDIESIAVAYRVFVSDEALAARFGLKEIPFALVGNPQVYSEIFSINRDSGKISLIWTEHYDPFNPVDWQIWKFERGNNLTDFIKMQVSMYK